MTHPADCAAARQAHRECLVAASRAPSPRHRALWQQSAAHHRRALADALRDFRMIASSPHLDPATRADWLRMASPDFTLAQYMAEVDDGMAGMMRRPA